MKRSLNKQQTQQTIMNNTDTTFAAVTAWISIADAKTKRAELIAQGLDKKQVKLSSYRWVDVKDHSKGYICRVLIVKGLRPEMEIETARPRKQNTNAIGTFATELATGNSCGESQNLTFYCRRNNVDETMTA